MTVNMLRGIEMGYAAERPTAPAQTMATRERVHLRG